MTFWVQDDNSVINRVRANEAARAYRAQQAQSALAAQGTEADWVKLLNDYADAFPEMEESVAVGLAKAGIRANSKEAQEIAAKSVLAQKWGGSSGSILGDIGDVLHPIGDTVGKVLSPIGKAGDVLMGNVDETLSPAVKGAVRTSMVVLESGFQEAQTFIRSNLAAQWQAFTDIETPSDAVDYALNPMGRRVTDAIAYGAAEHEAGGGSSGYQSISDLIAGKDVDLGTGFLPDGDIGERRRQATAASQRVRVSGVDFGGPGSLSLTPGRFVAAFVSEPGTEPFNIVSGLADAAVTWYGDPANAALGAAADARLGQRIGRGVRATRDDGLAAGLAEVAAKPRFVDNLPDGRIPGIRPTTLPDETAWWLDKQMRRVVDRIAQEPSPLALDEATKHKLPAELLAPLADATTPDEVAKILHREIGTGLAERPEYLGFKAKRAYGNGVRLLGTMPGAVLDPGNLRGSLTQMDDFLRNAKATPELRRSAFDRLARQPRREEMVSVVGDIMDDLAAELVEKHRPLGAKPISPARARNLTRLARDDMDRMRAYFVNEIASNRRAGGVMVGSTMIDSTDPYLLNEFLNSTIPMHDAREIRRATSTFARLVDNPFWEGGVDALNGLQGKWKQVALLRGAYTVRVIGEEQVRMAASGLDSMVAHPISAISAMIADPDGGMVKLRGRLRQSDALGQSFVDEFGDVISPELQGALSRGWAGWAGDEVFDSGYRLFEPHEEGFTRAWGQAIGRSHKEPVLRKIAEAKGNLDDVSNWYWDGPGQWHRKRLVEAHPELATRDGADKYLSIVKEGLGYRTAGGHPELLDAIATGSFNGKRIGRVAEGGRWSLDPDFVTALDDLPKPASIQGQALVRSREQAKVWDNAVGWMFSHLMTKPTNYLSRSPAFRQFYWNRIEEMVPFMDDATRASILRNAEGVVDAKQFGRMAAAKAAPEATLALADDADMLAKSHALAKTKHLLYDLTEKSQFFDTFRLLFPFGEAWKEVVTRWASIGVNNPKVFRRGQQIITGARGNGFFHKDVNGEEVFNYPFSRQIAKMTTGVPLDFTGRVAGLSLMTDILPGVGPLVQIPAAALVPETPQWNWVRNIVSPFGEQDYSQGILESFLPGHARNIAQFFKKGDPRLMANTVGAIMDSLASTGDYNLNDPDDQRRLIDDAREKARYVYLLRGLIQFGAPTAPMPEFLVETKDGDLDVSRVILEDLHKMQKEDYDSAVGRFLDKYGTDLTLMLKGKSISVPAILPTSKQSAEWAVTHSDVVKEYRNVWGIFAPQDEEDFDYVEYVRQFKTGDRFTLTPEQRIALAQARVGRWIYEQAKAKVGDKPSKMDREWLAAVKLQLREEYPGYGEMVGGLPSQTKPETTIKDLERAVVDPRLSNTTQAKAIRLYLEARRRAIAWANEVGVKTLAAQAAEPAREWLARIGAHLAEKYPEFQQTFDIVFSQEVD